MTDDFAAEAISAYGHPISELAPISNIDRIAKDGVIFKNALLPTLFVAPIER